MSEGVLQIADTFRNIKQSESSKINTFIHEIVLGGTIDYIKSNDTAKQLPDKCVKALDKYFDNINKEEEKRNENESE